VESKVQWISHWNPVFRPYYEVAVSSIDRVITETWVFSCCAEACVISSIPPLPKIVQAEKCDYSFWLGAKVESRQWEREKNVCLSVNSDSMGWCLMGSTCSGDPPTLPTKTWPSGACIYGKHAWTWSISLEMQIQTYLVQTVVAESRYGQSCCQKKR